MSVIFGGKCLGNILNEKKFKKYVNYPLQERSSGKFNIQKNANAMKILK